MSEFAAVSHDELRRQMAADIAEYSRGKAFADLSEHDRERLVADVAAAVPAVLRWFSAVCNAALNAPPEQARPEWPRGRATGARPRR